VASPAKVLPEMRWGLFAGFRAERSTPYRSQLWGLCRDMIP